MRQQKDLSPTKQIERLEKQIVKYGDPKKKSNRQIWCKKTNY